MTGTIGRYEIQSEIGRGAMGVVYRAHDPLLRRVIALKTILHPPGIAAEAVQEFEERFFQEARAAARLSHHAIVLVHDIGRDPETGTLYMALEFLSGQTIAQMTSGGQALDWRDAVTIAETVAEALYHAALMGVIHRDVKPANIMVLPSGQPKIMDFGVAKIETARLKLTGVGESFGTPLYMSPEQALGQDADPRSDVFSLGATLYRMVTGRDAFAAANIPMIIKRVVQDDPEPPSRVEPAVPATLDLVLARALAKDPEDRYPDAKSMADDLRDVLNDQPPRHASAGSAGDPGTGTMAEEVLELVEEPAFDPAAEIAALVPDTPGASPATERSEPVEARQARGVGFPSTRLTAAASLVLIGIALAASLRRHPGTEPGTPSPARPAATTTPEPQTSRPAPAAAPGSPAREAVAPATLLIDLEHGLKSGRLRVWVDGDFVLEEQLDSRVTKKVLVLKSRKGGVEETLKVGPGLHEIKVQVAWDDNVKTQVISGTFRSGATRRLAARVGGRIRKSLSVEWE